MAGLASLAFVGQSTAGAQAPSHPIVAQLRGGSWPPRYRDAFVGGMAELGLVEDRDYVILYRSTDGESSRLPALIEELIALNPAVIVAQTTGIAVELRKASDTIPIVATLTNPVELGLAVSIARPGGNVTGIIASSASSAKLVEMLLEVVPGASRIGVLLNRGNAGHVAGFPKVVADLASVPVTLVPVDARTPSEIDPAFQKLATERIHAMYIGADAMFNQEIKRIADLALAARLAAAYGFRIFPDAGGLMSYGNNLVDNARRFGAYAAKILRGEKPGDLPIEQQAKLELVMNMRTAKALALTMPPVVLARTDELIE